MHTHDLHHRVLPVKDVHVLPTKHFAPLGPNGELIEIDGAQIPGRVGKNQSWQFDSKGKPIKSAGMPNHFTAREFSDDEGREKHYVSSSGVPTTETTWIHPPRIEASEPQGVSSTQPEHERRADDTIAAHGMNVINSTPSDLSNRKFAQQPVQEQEHRAAAAVVAARRAADNMHGRAPGSFVD